MLSSLESAFANYPKLSIQIVLTVVRKIDMSEVAAFMNCFIVQYLSELSMSKIK